MDKQRKILYAIIKLSLKGGYTMSLQKEFEALGCWSAPTEEEHISVYGLDFDNCYIIFTDLDGKTPVDAKAPVVAACYDDRDAFMWGKELKDFAALKALRAAHADDEAFIAAVENYMLPKE